MGGQDSVYVSYNDLRSANAKMVELKYTKEINNKLNTIIKNDSVIINEQESRIKVANKKIKKYKTRSNILGVSTITAILVAIFSFL